MENGNCVFQMQLIVLLVVESTNQRAQTRWNQTLSLNRKGIL
jgi:hypothetical protein